MKEHKISGPGIVDICSYDKFNLISIFSKETPKGFLESNNVMTLHNIAPGRVLGTEMTTFLSRRHLIFQIFF